MTATGAPTGFGRENAIHVIQGQYAVAADPSAFICTLLGSCVAACIRDPSAGIGGMNHFLLPEGEGGSQSLSYGVNAMELLINNLLQSGASRDRLEAKLFGGARVINGVSDIGRQNVEFAKRFLEDEGIPFAGGSVGGVLARRIEFWPATGRVRQQMINRSEELVEVERQSARAPVKPDGGLELF